MILTFFTYNLSHTSHSLFAPHTHKTQPIIQYNSSQLTLISSLTSHSNTHTHTHTGNTSQYLTHNLLHTHRSQLSSLLTTHHQLPLLTHSSLCAQPITYYTFHRIHSQLTTHFSLSRLTHNSLHSIILSIYSIMGLKVSGFDRQPTSL